MNGTNKIARRARTYGRSMVGSVLRILPLIAVSLVGTLIVPAIHASEVSDNQAVLTQYMHTFQMDDWHFQLVMVDKAFLDNILKHSGSVGASQLNPITHYGVVWVLRRSEYTPEMFKSLGMHPQDQEWVIVDQRNTVVHELLHSLWRYCTQEELCVAMLAEAVIPHEETQ